MTKYCHSLIAVTSFPQTPLLKAEPKSSSQLPMLGKREELVGKEERTGQKLPEPSRKRWKPQPAGKNCHPAPFLPWEAHCQRDLELGSGGGEIKSKCSINSSFVAQDPAHCFPRSRLARCVFGNRLGMGAVPACGCHRTSGGSLGSRFSVILL